MIFLVEILTGWCRGGLLHRSLIAFLRGYRSSHGDHLRAMSRPLAASLEYRCSGAMIYGLRMTCWRYVGRVAIFPRADFMRLVYSATTTLLGRSGSFEGGDSGSWRLPGAWNLSLK